MDHFVAVVGVQNSAQFRVIILCTNINLVLKARKRLLVSIYVTMLALKVT